MSPVKAPTKAKSRPSGIARRIAMIKAAGDIPVITLVSAPDWMKEPGAG